MARYSLTSGPGIMAAVAGVAGIGGVAILLARPPDPGGPPEMSAVLPEDRAAAQAPAASRPPAARPPEAAPEEVAAAPADAANDAAPVAAARPQPEPEPRPGPGADPDTVPAPAFVVVRAEADGRVLVAGTAAPGHDVRVEVDGTAAVTTPADASGGVVLFFDLPPSDRARVLDLVSIGPDGTERRAERSVVLAPPPVPDAAPPAMAQAGPETPRVTGGTASQLNEPVQAPEIARENPAPGAPDTAPPDLARTSPQTPAIAEENAPEPASDQAAGEQTRRAGQASETEARPAPSGATESAGPIPADPAPQAPQERSAPAADTAAADTAADPAPGPDGARPGGPAAGTGPAPRAPAVLLAGQQGVRLMQPSATARAADRVIVDVISYDADGTVTLEGRGAPPPPPIDRVRVYLDNTPVQDAPIAEDGTWRLPLSDVESGVYTLRVDQLDTDGNVVSRFETPFKREDPADLARFSANRAPAEGQVEASVITVQPGYTLWGIADDRYGSGLDYVAIFEANDDQIRDPDLIYPGQVFDLPDLPDLTGGDAGDQ